MYLILDFAFLARLDSKGFLTSDLVPEEAGHNTSDGLEKKLVYHFDSFGVNYELQVMPNDELVSLSGLVQTIHARTVGREDVTTEYLIDEGCHLMGWAHANGHSNNTNTLWGRVAVSVCDGNMVSSLFQRPLCF